MAATNFNFEYYTPSYLNLLNNTYFSIQIYRQKLESMNYTFPTNCVADFSRYFRLSGFDVVLVAVLTILWTLLRWQITEVIFKPLAKYLSLSPSDREKVPENFWKFLFYSSTVSYNAYLLFGTKEYNFIERIEDTFSGWEPGSNTPPEVYFYYLAQGSFYVHSIFATIFMDVWRRDSLAMLIHHVVTVVLIMFSYAMRYTNIGLVVLFLHDINDAELEFIRLNVHLKRRGGKYYPIHEWISNIGFLVFTVTWVISRLYYFPTRVLYYSGVVATGQLFLPFTSFLSVLLWVIFLLNIYWFMYIVALLVKVVSGQMDQLADVREYEDEVPAKNGEVAINGSSHLHNNNFAQKSAKSLHKAEKEA